MSEVDISNWFCQRKMIGSGFAPLLPRFSGSSQQSFKNTQGKPRPPSLLPMEPTA